MSNEVATFTTSLVFNGLVAIAIVIGYFVLGRFGLYPSVDKNPWRDLFSYKGPEKPTLESLVRFFAATFLPMVIVNMVVLLPLNATGTKAVGGLDQLTFSNIERGDYARLWVHLIFVWLNVAYLCFRVIDMIGYIGGTSRHHKSHYNKVLLVRNIPSESEFLSLVSIFNNKVAPDWIQNVFVGTHDPEMQSIFQDIIKQRNILEYDISCVIKASQGTSSEESRPQRRKWFLFGPKVDCVQDDLEVLDKLYKKLQDAHLKGTSKTSSSYSAFVVFNSPIKAYMSAFLKLIPSSTLMVDRVSNIKSEKDIIWKNVSLTLPERELRGEISFAIIVALTIFWGIIVSFFVSLANLDNLTTQLPWLEPIVNFSPVVYGLLAGVLPSAVVAILLMVLYILVRELSIFEGPALFSLVELSSQRKMVFFETVNVFLVSVLAGTAIQQIQSIVKDPTSVPFLLANSMPRTSTFFINYIMLQSAFGPTMFLLQTSRIVTWVLGLVKGVQSPRSIWESTKNEELNLSLTASNHLLIVTMGIVFSTLAPLLGIFVLIYFVGWVLAYTTTLEKTYSEPEVDQIEFLFQSVMQSMIGIYIYLLTMTGIFLSYSGWVQGAFTVVLLIIVIRTHMWLNSHKDHLLAESLSKVDMMERPDTPVAEDPIKQIAPPSQKFLTKEKTLNVWVPSADQDVSHMIPPYTVKSQENAYFLDGKVKISGPPPDDVSM